MEKEYYLLDGDEKTGPYTYSELVQNGLDVNTQLSTAFSDKWQYASEMPEFIDYFKLNGIHFPTGDNLASFFARLGAFLIDYLPLNIGIELIAFKTGLVEVPADYSFGKPMPGSLLGLYLVFNLAFLLYRVIMETSPLKATFGKKICNLVVVNIDGNQPTFASSLLRNLGVILSTTLWIPFLSIFFSEHKQAWYDSLAKTYVVKTV